jgi:serine/threonine-protein kinase mTOR
MSESTKVAEQAAPAEPVKLNVNQQHLKQAWDTSRANTRDDWSVWLHRLSVEFLKESPSHALRACMNLVELHNALARELFNAAFLSCWGELYEQYQVDFFFHIEPCL